MGGSIYDFRSNLTTGQRLWLTNLYYNANVLGPLGGGLQLVVTRVSRGQPLVRLLHASTFHAPQNLDLGSWKYLAEPIIVRSCRMVIPLHYWCKAL